MTVAQTRAARRKLALRYSHAERLMKMKQKQADRTATKKAGNPKKT